MSEQSRTLSDSSHAKIAAAKQAAENQRQRNRVFHEFDAMKSEIEQAAAREHSFLSANDVAQMCSNFFRLAQQHRIKPRWDAIDHDATQRNYRDRNCSDDEAGAAYALARQIVDLGFQDGDVATLIRQVHGDAYVRPALRYVEILIQVLAGRNRLDTIPLSKSEALDTAKWLHDFFAEQELSAEVLFEVELKSNRLGEAIGQLGIENSVPRINLRKDSAALIVETLKAVVNRLSAFAGQEIQDKTVGQQTSARQPEYARNANRKIPKEEAEVLVRDWLKKNAKDNPMAVTRDQIAKDTGVSAGGVSNTAAWQAFDNARKETTRPAERAIPLSDKMQAVIPSDCPTPPELVELIEEQEADRQADTKHRHKSRHEPS
jgi:hypothetical protein